MQIDTLVREAGAQPMCLGGSCKDGHPLHPVIGPYRELRPWLGPEVERLMQ
jgi:hypothetical protein